MNARQLREQIETIDRRLKELGPWEKQSTAARRQWLLEDTDEARDAVTIIEDGLRPGQGRPMDLELPALDAGWPGLHPARETIEALKERRGLLVAEQPSKAETAKHAHEAEARATDIRKRAEELAARTESAHAALNGAACLALAVAEDTRRLWEDNAALDKLANEADIARPSTPRVEAAHFPVAVPLSTLLRSYFHGGQPGWLDPNLIRETLAVLGEE